MSGYGALAQGLESGFNIGMKADAAAESKKQREFDNTRQLNADKRTLEHDDQQRRRQEWQDGLVQSQASYKALMDERESLSKEAAAAASEMQRNGQPDPQAQSDFVQRWKANGAQLKSARDKLVSPQVAGMKQEAQDLLSRQQTGQPRPEDNTPGATVKAIVATTDRPLTDFIGKDGKPSAMGQAIADFETGHETGNETMLLRGLNTLFAPELSKGVGETYPDGSVITGKRVVRIVPDEKDPTKVHPVLAIESTGPDGTPNPPKIAPVTEFRSTHAGDNPISISMADAIERIGKFKALDAWTNNPKNAKALEQGQKEAAPDVDAYFQALRQAGVSPTGAAKLTQHVLPAGSTLVSTDAGGKVVSEVKGQPRAGVLESKLAAIDKMVEDGTLEMKEAASLKRDITLGAGGKTTGLIPQKASTTGGELTPEAIDLTAESAIKDRSTLIGLGRDPNTIKKVINRMAELSQGTDIAGRRAEFKADAKSLDTIIPKYDAITAFESNAIQQGKVLVDLAKKIDTTGVPVVERWLRAGRQNVAGDPDVSEFNAQLKLYTTEAAKILTNPNLTGVVTDNSQREVQEILPKAASFQQVERVVSRFESDFNIRKSEMENQIDAIKIRLAKQSKGSGLRDRMSVEPKEQQGRDVEAGKLMINSEYGGDVSRARADYQEMMAGVKAAPAGEARSMLESKAGRLKAGLDSMGANKSSAASTSAPTAYATEAEAEKAFAAGKFKVGDPVVIGGRRGKWGP